MTPGLPKRTICFLVLPHVHLMDLAGPAQVFYEATQIGSHPYVIRYCGLKKEARSEQGILLSGLEPMEQVQLNAGDFLFVAGIDFHAFQSGQLKQEVQQIKKWLHQLRDDGVNLASVCSGSLILAATGILNGKKCTSHWKCIDYIKENFPKVSVQTDQLFVKENGIYTSAGMTSGIDMALSIIEKDHGPILAAKVAREIVVYMRRNETDRQQTIYLDYKTHFNPAIHKVQDYIISHPAKNPGLEELAALCNTSTRNLTRMFKKATGHTLVDFKNAVKAELARTLTYNADYTIEKIATLTGFQSARHLRRVWSKHFKEPIRRTGERKNG